MRVWEDRSIKSLAVRRDLYTSVAEGRESDRIERWLNQEIETPALPVLDRLCKMQSLNVTERKTLARYIAALSARSPLYYSEHTRIMAENIGGVLDATVKESLKRIEEAQKVGKRIETRPDAGRGFRSIAFKIHRERPQPELEVSVVIGRELWLDSIEHVVNHVSAVLESHDWQVFRPYGGWTWYTSDNPVVRLNYYPNGTYDFKGGFANPGGELLLPLSARHLLYTHIDRPRSDYTELSLEHTIGLKRCIAQNAFRWIAADSRTRNAEWFMPRVVHLAKYNAEENAWKEYNKDQANAELNLKTLRDS